uniref:RHS repeat domain-containing protein n=1 Tax=Duganella sp. S19_KUP01_CR8 TaxID=3025502 RepID=UPI002FCDC352
VYAGAQEVENTAAGIKVKTYWPQGVGVEIDEPSKATALYWTHADRLGSPAALSDQNGDVQESLAYDAWGKRRALTTQATDDNIDGKLDNKGYTGHETLDTVDLVHMNGRVYDPLIGRFLSGDPLVQDPVNGQSYNRYSYVLNNPTNLTDPTGFCGKGATEVTGSPFCHTSNESAARAAEASGTKGTDLQRPGRDANGTVVATNAGRVGPDSIVKLDGKGSTNSQSTNLGGANPASDSSTSGIRQGAMSGSPNGAENIPQVIIPGKVPRVPVEVITEQPVGWGASSLGHAAISMRDTVYTFTHGGMKILPKADYLRANQFRNTIGAVVNVSQAKAAQMEFFLSSYQAEYSVMSLSTCVQPVYLSLVIGGVLNADNPPLFPASLGNQVIDSGKVKKVNFYEKTTPASGADFFSTRPSSN